MWRLPPLMLLLACDIDTPFDVAVAPCDARRVWYPDADGDGLGEDGEIYVSCKDPGQGWTETPPPSDTDTDP